MIDSVRLNEDKRNKNRYKWEQVPKWIQNGFKRKLDRQKTEKTQTKGINLEGTQCQKTTILIEHNY